MNPKIYKFWIFLIVLLICSITPTTAIQNNPNHLNDEEDWMALFNETYIKDMTNLLNNVEEASNTELTPEQDQYLEQHEPNLLAKAEAILYNLQDFLNIILTELQTENNTNLKQVKEDTDPEMNKFDKSVKKMVDYLNKHTVFNGLSWKKCTCSELNKLVVDKTYNNGYVVIEVKDPLSSKGYVRYVELVNIYRNSEGEKIQLKVGSKYEELTWEQFKNIYGYGNANNKGTFNIIPTNNYPAHMVLESICTKQKEDLMDKKTGLATGLQISAIFAAGGGLAVMFAGLVRLCDYCSPRVIQRITEIAGDPEAAAPLLEHNGATKTYTRITEEQRSTSRCNKCTIAVGIITSGTIIIIGSIVSIVTCLVLMNKYDKELDNLKHYIP